MTPGSRGVRPSAHPPPHVARLCGLLAQKEYREHPADFKKKARALASAQPQLPPSTLLVPLARPRRAALASVSPTLALHVPPRQVSRCVRKSQEDM